MERPGALRRDPTGRSRWNLALASRAFAFYYVLQCLVAHSFARSPLERAGFLGLAAVLLFITAFSVPAG